MFLSDQCLGKACYERCKFKNESSSADIRIGDFWGNTFANNENGVSAIAVFTEKGAQAVIQSNCKLTPFPFEIISEGQMKVPPKRDWRYTKLNSMLRDNSTTLKDMIIILDRHDLMRHLTFPFRHPLKTISNIIVKRTLRIKKK